MPRRREARARSKASGKTFEQPLHGHGTPGHNRLAHCNTNRYQFSTGHGSTSHKQRSTIWPNMRRTPFIYCSLYTRLFLACSLSLSLPLFPLHVLYLAYTLRGELSATQRSALGSRTSGSRQWGVSWMSLRRLYVVHVSGRGLYVGLIGFADANEESNF